MNWIASAPGKVILNGEHAVVYGRRAIAAAICLRTTVSLKILDGPPKLVVLWTYNQHNFSREFDLIEIYQRFKIAPIDEYLLKSCIKELLKSEADQTTQAMLSMVLTTFFTHSVCSSNKLKSLIVTIESELEIGSGLGSSASLSACISAIFICASRNIKNLSSTDTELIHEINCWSKELEKFAHKNPSGIDNTVCVYGGVINFINGEFFSVTDLFDGLELLVIYSGKSHNSVEVIERVSKMRSESLEQFEKVISRIGDISDEIICQSHQSKNSIHFSNSITSLLEESHTLLCDLGVGCVEANSISKICKEHGCVAKITGAGCGGCLFVILPTDKESGKLQDSLETQGYRSKRVKISCSGIRCDVE